MDLNNFEQGGLKNLQNHRTGFDKDAMWDEMKEKKKQRPILWLWSGASLLLIGIIGFYFLFDFEKSTPIADVILNEKIIIETTNSDNYSNEKMEDTIPNSTSEKSLTKISEVKKTTNFLIENSKHRSIKSSRQQNTKQSSILPTKEKFLQEKFQIKLLSMRVTDLEMETKLKLKTPTLKEVKLIKRLPKVNNFSIDFYAGIGSHFRLLEKKNALVSDDFFNFRKKEIRPIESYAFGIGLTKSINRKWSIGSGVEIVIHQESFKYQRTIVENTGTLDLNSGTDPNTFLVTEENSTYYNQFYQLNAPIFLGYQMHTRKIRIEPQLGVVLNWNHSSNGEYKNEEEILTDLAPFYKKGFGVSYRFGFKFSYVLGNQTLLSIHPKYDWNPNDWTTAQNIISEKRNTIRLDLGISKGF